MFFFFSFNLCLWKDLVTQPTKSQASWGKKDVFIQDLPGVYFLSEMPTNSHRLTASRYNEKQIKLRKKKKCYKPKIKWSTMFQVVKTKSRQHDAIWDALHIIDYQ